MTALRLTCARCGKRQPAEAMTFSRFSRRHYCLAFEQCDRRAARRKRDTVTLGRAW